LNIYVNVKDDYVEYKLNNQLLIKGKLSVIGKHTSYNLHFYLYDVDSKIKVFYIQDNILSNVIDTKFDIEVFGSGEIKADNNNNSAKKISNTSWNSMFRLKYPLKDRMKFQVSLLKNVSALFIGITNESNTSETGYFKTVGMYANTQLKCDYNKIDYFINNFQVKEQDVIEVLYDNDLDLIEY